MFKKIAFTFLLIGFVNSSFSQTNLNDYKYVIVPSKFEFLKEADKYQLNSLTKFLFEKHGFQAVKDNESFPEDLSQNRCLGLFSDVEKENGMFKTKLKVTLKDCNNVVLYETKIGESREKEYVKAYNLALRGAFKSFESMNYSYVPNEEILAQSKKTNTAELATTGKIEELKKEIETLKKEKEIVKQKTISETLPEVKELESKTEEPRETPKSVKEIEKKDLKKIEEVKKMITDNEEGLDTKEIFNGFKLLDNKSKEVMTIFSSGIKDVFIVKGKDAIIYKKGDNWIYSETNETNLLTKLVKINF